MIVMRFVVFCFLIASFAGLASHGTAATAYKCIGAKGAISFQDQPCRAGEKQATLSLPDSEPAATATTDAPPPPPTRMPPREPPTPAPPPQNPAPTFYICARADGSRYMSETGQGGSSAVPTSITGVAGQSLADAYGGPNGIGVSAPGLRQIPHKPAASVPFGGTYMWIDDQCHFAQPAEACGYLRSELDKVNAKLPHSFSDEEPQLKQQQSDIRERMRGC